MQIAEMKARPPHLRFENIAVEDRNATVEAGHPVFKEVAHVHLTPVGSRDSVTKEVSEWLLQNQRQVDEERLPREWADNFRRAFEHWKAGEEMPLNGSPIRTWPGASAAEIASCKAVHVLTVEDLAQANDETVRRLGMGGLELKKRALRFLDEAHGAGRLVAENAALRAELADVKSRAETTEARLAQLEKASGVKSPVQIVGVKPGIEEKL